MKTINFTERNTSTWLRVLYCLALPFSFSLGGCANKVLNDFSRLETEALKYGTVSVGAARVADYNKGPLRKSRKRLQKALKNIHNELGGGPRLSTVTADPKRSTSEKESPKAPKVQTTGPSEIELVRLRMAALKFVESELKDLELDCVSPNEPDFRRVVVSLDCSAWVRGDAGAALVYIDLYPCNADKWCHGAANLLKCFVDAEKYKKGNKNTNEKLCAEEKLDPETWRRLMRREFAGGFGPFDLCTIEPPDPEKLSKEDSSDLVAFCHRWLGQKKLFPHIVHVERMGAAEYLLLAEEDYSASKFGIRGAYPGLPSGELGIESRREAQLKTAAVRPLSLAFIAGNRRAGWLFMPTKTREGKMLPTERRLRMVVDIPKNMLKLSIHVHKVFLRPDLSILPDASLVKQMDNLKQAREYLTKADELYEEYKERPEHYRLIKTRMRNLLYQGWAEEIPVDIPARGN